MPLTKRSDEPVAINLPAATLYIDDLEDILEAIRQVNGNVQMETTRYSFTQPSDLAELKGPIDHVSFSTDQEPLFQVTVGRSVASVLAWPSKPDVRGVAEQIREIVARRRRPLAWVGHPVLTGAAVKGRVVVVRERFGQTPPFLVRNRDALIINLFVAIIGALIGAIASRLAS